MYVINRLNERKWFYTKKKARNRRCQCKASTIIYRLSIVWKSDLFDKIKRGFFQVVAGQVGWGSRIHRLHLFRGIRLPNYCLGYDTKSDVEAPVILELWGWVQSTLLPSFPGPLWPGVVASDKVLSMGQIELNSVLTLNWIVWNRTVLTFKLRSYAKLNCLKRTVLTFNRV